MQNQDTIKNVTATIIYDGSALNRDEKIGGNILSIKKMNVNGKQRSFTSKPSFRHHLFNTLITAFDEDWKPAAVTGQGKVVQFDLLEDDILTSAELDAFGYMYTIGGQRSITRKAPIHITKAVSLYEYNTDLAFYANHDLVNRGDKQGLQVKPNPYTKEEHNSLYKISLTIDSKVFGRDEWIIEEKPKFQEGKLYLYIEKPKADVIQKVEKKTDEENWKNYYLVDGKHRIDVKGISLRVDTELIQKLKPSEEDETPPISFNKKYIKGSKKAKVEISQYDESEESGYEFILNDEPEYDSENKTLEISLSTSKIIECKEIGDKVYENEFGFISWENLTNEGPYKVVFELKPEIKQKRIQTILNTFMSGLVAKSSGEPNTTIPLVCVVAGLTVPSPIFHSLIDIDNATGRLIGLKDCLNKTNFWLETKIFMEDSERINIDPEILNNKNVERKWNNFLKSVNLGDKNEDS